MRLKPPAQILVDTHVRETSAQAAQWEAGFKKRFHAHLSRLVDCRQADQEGGLGCKMLFLVILLISASSARHAVIAEEANLLPLQFDTRQRCMQLEQ